MKLYNYWRSSSSWRVRIALEHKGLDYEYVPVHLVDEGGIQHTEWFRAMNPAAQVPVLEVELEGATRYLGQSMAIFEFLEERHPQPAFLPSDPYHRAKARQLAELVNSGIQPIQNLSVIQHLRGLDQDARGWCAHWIERGLASYVTTMGLEHGRFSVGDQPTWADACLIPQLYNERRFSVDLTQFPELLEIEANCFELEAFQAAHPDRQPDAVVS